jgi:PPM family protein phosphatase
VTSLLAESTFEMAALTDPGTEREHNEDFCACAPEAGLVAVADGVSGALGGETASRMAVEATLRAFREQPASVPAGRRLARAAQQANIEVHERSLFVPELRGMSTTLTAAAIDCGHLYAVHVGDSRLYLMRKDVLSQLSKDHTAAAEHVRLRGPGDPSCILTRSLGRELICALDRFSMPVQQDDVLLLCSDGLHRVLADAELEEALRDADVGGACKRLIETANARGAADNLTAAVIRITGAIAPGTRPPGLLHRVRELVGI